MILASQNTSIVELFDQLDSKVTQFKSKSALLKSNQSEMLKLNVLKGEQQCSCFKNRKIRNLQKNYYQEQLKLLQNAESISQKQQNQAISKLLPILLENTSKIVQLLGEEVVCPCKRLMIDINCIQFHKVNFLREQNDKFFKIIQQKMEECHILKQKIYILQSQLNCNIQQTSSIKMIRSQLIQINSDYLNETKILSEYGSKTYDYQNQGIIGIPKGQHDHRKYFKGPSDRNTEFQSKSGLFEQDKNKQFYNYSNKTSKRAKF